MSDTNAILAKFVGVDPAYLDSTNRNDLAEVLGRLSQEQVDRLHVLLSEQFDEARMNTGRLGNVREMWTWCCTCDPAIIAAAVARVVGT